MEVLCHKVIRKLEQANICYIHQTTLSVFQAINVGIQICNKICHGLTFLSRACVTSQVQ